MMKTFLFAACMVAMATAECDVADTLKCIADGNPLSLTDKCERHQKTLDCSCDCATSEQISAAQEAAEKDGCSISCGCFPATAKVQLANNKSKTLDELTIGDKVHVGAGQFSEVYYFSTQLSEVTSKFVKISTSQTSTPLLLTARHYLYVNGELLEARSVKVGDMLTLGDGSKAEVEDVSSAWAPGLFNPHTMTGDIVIDGVLTSTYTEAVHPTLAHALLMPLRTLYQAGMTFGQDFNKFAKGLPQWILKAVQA